jgi:RNA recognition motif-containing protein
MNDAELTHEALAVMNGSRLDGAAITVKLNDNPNSNPNPRERADRGQRERPAAKVTSPLHPPLLVLPPRVRCAPELSAISAHARVCLPLPPQVVPDSTRLFVTGLHPGVDWSALKDHFKYIGPVQYCDVYTYKDASHAGRDMLGKSKGCGVVQMMDARAAMEAMQELNGSTLMGQAIAVKQDTHAAAFVPSYDDYGDARPPQRDAAYDRGDRNERPPREQQYGARGGGGDWDNERPPREQQYGARGGGGDWDNERPPRSGGEREPRERAPRPERAAAAPAPRLYVGGLAQATTWKELKDHFAALGPVAYCDVKLHKVGTAAVAANPALEGTSKVWLPASARPETALVSVAGFSGCERLANHPSTASIPSLQLCECLRRAIGPTG